MLAWMSGNIHAQTPVCVFDRMREVDLGSGRALLIKEHGEFSAIGHKCPHYGAPLVKGELWFSFLFIHSFDPHSFHLNNFSFLSVQVSCRKVTCAVPGMVHVSTLQQETLRTSRGWTACRPSRWPSPLMLSLSHSPPYHVSKHHQKVNISLMSVCSRSELKRTRWSFAQTNR